MLHLSHDLKGAAAVTDPRDTDTTDTPADELPETALDDVTGGSFTELIRSGDDIVGLTGWPN